MKYRLVIHLAMLLVYCGCNEFKPDPVQEFIPGVYIRFSQHEFGTEYDTLHITVSNDQFSILRKWKYERILDGVAIEPEYKKQTATGRYDADNGLLLEEETGSTYSFDLKNKILLNGTVKYKKL